MIDFQKGSTSPKLIAVLIVVIVIGCIYYFEFLAPKTNSISLPGYVVYESPADSGYNFLILGAINQGVNGTLPTMEGFPVATDPNYRYISYAQYKGTLPSIGDKVSVTATMDNTVPTNPPYTFALSATSIDILLSAQFNSTIEGLMQSIK